MRAIKVIGGGPAGSAAAIAARQAGADVLQYEKSHFPRHKVCGEYLSPEIAPVLESLGVWDDFLAARPAAIRRLALHFPSSEKRCKLPAAAYGLSRYCFDDLLFRRAASVGAQQMIGTPPVANGGAVVLAGGRKDASTRGDRLFGFKAHFEGPANDEIELFFFDGCYAGVSAVEGGVTNVCGLAPEEVLRRHSFEIDAVVHSSYKLAEKIRPLRIKMKWLTVGPLIFKNNFRSNVSENEYPAGDALSFVDPFTGSGMLSAITAGRLAGLAAARGTPAAEYVAQCRRRLETPFQCSSLIRSLIAGGWAERLTGLIPGHLLVWLTRPHRVL